MSIEVVAVDDHAPYHLLVSTQPNGAPGTVQPVGSERHWALDESGQAALDVDSRLVSLLLRLSPQVSSAPVQTAWIRL